MATLVYAGGATLTFGSGPARRTVKAGEPFDVPDDLAAILLRDPHVRVAGDEDVPRGTPERPTGPVTLADLPSGATKGGAAPSGLDHYRALKARAKEIGLPATGSSADLEAAIAAEEKRLADEAADASSSGERTEGGQEPGEDPGAVAPGEPGTPPSPDATGTGGAIVLGDEPAGS
jgi:hypothetical protein